MTPVRYHEAAEDELLNEIAYLEERVPGLGRRFYGEIQRAERLICKFPESAREVLPGIRGHPLRKFQYSLVYSIEEGGLLILAVAHHARRPHYWIGRASDTPGGPRGAA